MSLSKPDYILLNGAHTLDAFKKIPKNVKKQGAYLLGFILAGTRTAETVEPELVQDSSYAQGQIAGLNEQLKIAKTTNQKEPSVPTSEPPRSSSFVYDNPRNPHLNPQGSNQQGSSSSLRQPSAFLPPPPPRVNQALLENNNRNEGERKTTTVKVLSFSGAPRTTAPVLPAQAPVALANRSAAPPVNSSAVNLIPTKKREAPASSAPSGKRPCAAAAAATASVEFDQAKLDKELDDIRKAAKLADLNQQLPPAQLREFRTDIARHNEEQAVARAAAGEPPEELDYDFGAELDKAFADFDD